MSLLHNRVFLTGDKKNMQALLDAISNPGSMTGSQWLVLAIGLFIVLGSLYFVIKLFKIIKGIGKTSYTPNIGLDKHPYRGQAVNQAAQDQAEEQQDSGEASSTTESKSE
ncbi:MAG: hypothetical protein CMP91_11515 [Gammaproteobacteria bacterium]|nr:hypothetical protein [Gammaproteobacteria bacterium]MAY03397.1 hypothetical protein [Gammaproteobacteria bacterium]|tara:strand:- start:566 stop:895 length:330 start_codon:yes stop_codon:yes gene_type:complete